MIKRGDPVKVRLHTGEVVEAGYIGPHYVGNVQVKKSHLVEIYGGQVCTAGLFSPHKSSNPCINDRVRFVGNPCVLVPIGESK